MVGFEFLVLDLLKTPRGRIVLGLVMLAVAAFFWFFSYPQLSDARALRAHGRRVTAEVIDTQISTGAHGVERRHNIRYRFRLEPSGAWYTRGEKGPLARKAVWATLPKEQWERATRTLQVDVDYLPSDPSVNCLAGRADSELTGVYALMTFAAVFGVPGALMIAHSAYRLIMPRESPRLTPLRRA